MSQTTALKVIYDSHKYLFNYILPSLPEVPMIYQLNDAGLIITSHYIYIFFDDLLFYDRNFNSFFVYVQQFSGFLQ